MKKLLSTVAAIGCFVFCSIPSLAQWTTVTGGINYSGGKVGIGNATPYGMLHFVTSHNNRKIVLSSAAGVNNDHEFYGMGTSTDVFRFHIPSATRAYRFFRADDALNSTEIFTVLGSGNVGIGTSSPVSKLDVAGSFTTGNGTINLRPQNTTAEGGELVLEGAGTYADWNIDSFQGRLRFFNNGTSVERFSVSSSNGLVQISGSVGIGTTNPGTYKLAVAGKVAAWEEVKVLNPSSAFPDYVFAPSYKLRSLAEVESYIKQNQHLPEVPAAATVAQEGMGLVEMNTIAIKKIEELTLYLIEQNKRLMKLEQENQELQREVEALQK